MACYNEDINQLPSGVAPRIQYSMAYKPTFAAYFASKAFDSTFEAASAYSSSHHSPYWGKWASVVVGAQRMTDSSKNVSLYSLMGLLFRLPTLQGWGCFNPEFFFGLPLLHRRTHLLLPLLFWSRGRSSNHNTLPRRNLHRKQGFCSSSV